METETMGRVATEATIESLQDLNAVRLGILRPDQVRRVVVPDALVDTGATGLSLPTHIIRQLGLEKRRSKRVTSSNGVCEVAIYEAVRLTIEQWDCTVDVVEVPDEVPVLIGQVPLDLLDFVVDPRQRRLIANPAHGGEHMLEMY
jgi:clan AA aspartic protease